MGDHTNMRTAAEALVDQLVANGVRHDFCVPGESYLAVLDAMCDRDITLSVCRQEGGAAMMAEAVGKATGWPGICFVTPGPGATNASPGICIARHDSTPMLLFVGQVARGTREREAFQEIDVRSAFGNLAKWRRKSMTPPASEKSYRGRFTPRPSGLGADPAYSLSDARRLVTGGDAALGVGDLRPPDFNWRE